MAIKYTNAYYKCPNCGKILKRNSEAFSMVLGAILLLASFGTILFWLLGFKIIKCLYKTEGPVQLGNKNKECSCCGQVVCLSQGVEWAELNKEEKIAWAFRKTYWTALFFSGFPFISLLAQFVWLSPHESDRPITAAFLVIGLITLFIEVVLYMIWQSYSKKPYIEVSDIDFERINTSMKLTHSEWMNEVIPVKIKWSDKVYGTISENTSNTKKESPIQKYCNIGFVIGFAGIALFLGIVLIGLAIYGKVYLFNGYNYTKVLTIISFICMFVGLCSLLAKIGTSNTVTDNSTSVARPVANTDDEKVRRLLLYKDLLDKGAITQEEYEEKKRQILDL